MKVEKLLVNDAMRALARNAGILGSRRVLLHSLLPLVAPPWKRAKLRQRVRGYFREYFPEYDARTARLLADRYVHHWCCKQAEDVYAINFPDVHVGLAELDRLVVHEQPQRFTEAIRHGTGVLAVGAHVGALSIGTVALMARLRETTPEERPIIRLCTDPEMESYPSVFEGTEQVLRDFDRDIRFVITRRESRTIATEIAEALDRRAFVTTNLDVLLGGKNQRVFELFGRARVRLPALVGAAKVALRTGATILPWVCTRSDASFRLRLERPIGPVERIGPTIPDDHPALLALTEQLLDIVEAWVRWHPEQWVYWDRLHRRLVT